MRRCLLLALCLLPALAAGRYSIHAVRLRSGSSRFGKTNDGIVEVFVKKSASDSGRWGSVCKHGVADLAAAVFCYVMGYTNQGYPYNTAATAPGLQMVVEDLQCTLDASILSQYLLSACATADYSACAKTTDVLAIQCGDLRPTTPAPTTTPDMAKVAPVNCTAGSSALVRLVNGTSTSGRVEIRKSTSDPWLTICNIGFYNDAAKVICRMACLNADYAQAVTGNFAAGYGDIAFSGLTCPAGAASINNCTHSGWGSAATVCRHSMDAQVKCGQDRVVTPKVPVLTVSCLNATAEVTFNLTATPSVGRAVIQLLETFDAAKCGYAVTKTATEVKVSYKFTECGAAVTYNNTHSSYTNRLFLAYRPVGDPPIISDTNYTVPVVCRVPKASRMEGGNLKPKTIVLPPSEGTDQPHPSMTIYRDAAFTRVVAPGSTITVNEQLYVRVHETARLDNNKMVVRDCWATQAASRTSSPRKDLIRSGCPQGTVSALQSIDAKTQSFSFKAFVFGAAKTLYVHCDTNTCHKDDNSAQCTRACLNRRRRKRSIDALRRLLTGRSDEGPFYVQDAVGSSGHPLASLVLVASALLLRLM